MVQLMRPCFFGFIRFSPLRAKFREEYFHWYYYSYENDPIKILEFISGEFTIFADITETDKGYPRLQFDGYTFGRRTRQGKALIEKCYDDCLWVCTRNFNRKRCCARVETKTIDGYVMMRVKKPQHICAKWIYMNGIAGGLSGSFYAKCDLEFPKSKLFWFYVIFIFVKNKENSMCFMQKKSHSQQTLNLSPPFPKSAHFENHLIKISH